MTRILYPSGYYVAKFARGRDKKKRKKRTLGGYAATGAKYGALIGAGIGIPSNAILTNAALKAEPGYLPSMGLRNTPGMRRTVAGVAGLMGGANSALRTGLLGAGIGAGVYGAKKLKERLQNR